MSGVETASERRISTTAAIRASTATTPMGFPHFDFGPSQHVKAHHHAIEILLLSPAIPQVNRGASRFYLPKSDS